MTGGNTVSIIDLSTDTVTATITGFDGSYGVAVNPAGTDAYVTNYGAGTVTVLALTPLVAAPGTPAARAPRGATSGPR